MKNKLFICKNTIRFGNSKKAVIRKFNGEKMRKHALFMVGLIAITLMFSGCVSDTQATSPAEATATAAKSAGALKTLVVYSCGGPTEALQEVNSVFEKRYNCKVEFTGASAGTLRKALEKGAYADVFLPRSIKHSKILTNESLMEPDYKIYQFTEWVIITPKGNPKNITKLEDLLRDDVIVYTNSKAKIPEIKALKPKKELIEKIYEKSSKDYDCYRKMLKEVANGNADAAIVERRCTTLEGIKGNVEVIDIPREYLDMQKGVFTIGVMKNSKNKDLAYKYMEFVLSDEGQSILAKHGFYPVKSEKGQEILNNYYSEYKDIAPQQ
ncbi:MAG: molybdate transport system substrate-binding protein [Methanothermococcus sp.]|nr:molybdate transport system substrate-binding protein [Methanothermococcus sp.]